MRTLSKSFPYPYSMGVWSENGQRSFAFFSKNRFETMFRISFTHSVNGQCLAYCYEMGESRIGQGEQGAMSNLVPLLLNSFSNISFTKSFIPSDEWKNEKNSMDCPFFYTKCIYLTIEYPYSMVYPKNIYSPPFYGQCVRLSIGADKIKNMGKVIGKDGKFFIHFTEKYDLDYIWYNNQKKEIEIYGSQIPVKVVEEILQHINRIG